MNADDSTQAKRVTEWFDEYEDYLNYMRCLHRHQISVGDLDRCVRQQSPPPSIIYIFNIYAEEHWCSSGSLRCFNIIVKHFMLFCIHDFQLAPCGSSL